MTDIGNFSLVVSEGLPIRNRPLGDGSSSLSVNPIDGMVIPVWDHLDAAYPDDVTEIYTYKLAAATVMVVTVVYTDAMKRRVLSVDKVIS